jgi:uncharacterized protein (TIGR04255 family)
MADDRAARIKFQQPPINELVIGVYFEQPVFSLRAEHVGLFWSRMRREFPTIQQQPPVATPSLGNTFSIEITGSDELFPMPRFWISSKDEATLLQVQKNAFLLNWRKRETAYPHFEFVKAAFDKYLLMFEEFLRVELNTSTPNVQIAELTYINVIESGEYWRGPLDTSTVIPGFHVAGGSVEALGPPEFNQVATQRVATDMMLTTAIRSARQSSAEGKPVLVFEFRGVGLLGSADREDVDSWFGRAHDAIGCCFKTLTSPDIQKRYWRPVDS